MNTKNNEIHALIQKEMEEFMNAKYPGKLPVGFLTKLKVAIMGHSTSTLRFHTAGIKKILLKKLSELTFTDVGIACNIISSAKLSDLYKSVDECMENHHEIENLITEWNIKKGKKESELEEKRARMIKISSPALTVAQA